MLEKLISLAGKAANGLVNYVQEQQDLVQQKYDREARRIEGMSDERLKDYVKRNKDRLKNSVEGAACGHELRERGLINKD